MRTVVRVLLYPVTALLGPFVQDAIAATVRVGLEESSGLLPSLVSSCASRSLELEADNVALRLLAGAGVDPRASLAFWEDRLESSEEDTQDTGEAGRKVHAHMQAQGYAAEMKKESFAHTHPPDRERVAAIRKELGRWHTSMSAAAR